MKLHDELGCRGYYGFGGGVLEARRQRRGDGRGGEIYCTAGCPIAQECWDLHRERQRRHLPAVTVVFDLFAEKHAGSLVAMMDAYAAYQLAANPHAPVAADPYTSGLGANVEDGMAVGFGGTPKYRGRLQLPWPLVPIEQWLAEHPRDEGLAEWEAEVRAEILGEAEAP